MEEKTKKLSKAQRIKKAEKLTNRILEVVTNDWDYFKENPKHLAWAMMNFSLVHYAGRRIDSCSENPKDLVLNAGEKLSEEDSDLLYDAWGVTVSNQREFPDANPELPLESKSNKTLDEWIELCTDRNYEFRSIFPDAHSVESHLICCYGTGMGWNKDGFITHTGPSDVDESIFANYTRAEDEIRSDLKKQILKIRSNPLIIHHVNDYLKDAKINAGNNRAEKRIVNDSWKVQRKIEKIPKREQDKIMKAFRQVAYLEAIVNDAKYWTEEEWKEARKSNIYDYQGTEFDVSEIDLSFCHTTMDFGSHIAFSLKEGEKIKDYRKEGIINYRKFKWRNFVYKIENPDNPKVRKANAIIMKNISSEMRKMLKLKGKPPTKETDEKIKKARDYLNSQSPNLKEYNPILEKATNLNERLKKIDNTKLKVGVPVIWNDDGAKCYGVVQKKFYNKKAHKRQFYVVLFKDKDIGEYKRTFDKQSLKENLKINKGYLRSKERREAKKAGELLDRLANVPDKGWDSIRYFVLDEQRELNESSIRFTRKKLQKKEKILYYPPSKYSPLVTMPENAHPSYIKAGIRIAKEILKMTEDDISQKNLVKTYMAGRKHARQFLKKWDNPL